MNGIELFADRGEEDIPDSKLPAVAAHVVDTKASHFDSSTFIRYRLVGVLDGSDLRIARTIRGSAASIFIAAAAPGTSRSKERDDD